MEFEDGLYARPKRLRFAIFNHVGRVVQHAKHRLAPRLAAASPSKQPPKNHLSPWSPVNAQVRAQFGHLSMAASCGIMRVLECGPLAQLAEQLTLNQSVPRSSRGRVTSSSGAFAGFRREGVFCSS